MQGTLESELSEDLEAFTDRLADERFCAELYRSLTNRVLAKEDGPPGLLVLSWRRAETLVNELRTQRRERPLPLSRSDGEGVVSETVSEELERLGWRSRRLAG